MESSSLQLPVAKHVEGACYCAFVAKRGALRPNRQHLDSMVGSLGKSPTFPGGLEHMSARGPVGQAAFMIMKTNADL